MIDKKNSYKEKAQKWFASLRDEICAGLEKLELELDSQTKFKYHSWNRKEGGGGTVATITNGKVFEKGGVNISTVYGEFSEDMRKQIPGAMENPEFWASGISIVIHPRSPFVPIIHMNTRMIVTTKLWFGGGIDLTPTFIEDADAKHFHSTLKAACDEHNQDYYPKFKAECDKYFYLPHRKEARGIGGIFYDYHNSGNWENDFAFTKSICKTFLKAYEPIVRNNYKRDWNEEDHKKLLLKRGRYVEFNLLYDRGTKFGLMTDGNIEAILMSMPPVANWDVKIENI